MSPEPDGELFVESATFAQRNLVSPKGGDIESAHANSGAIGRDS